MKKVLCVTRKYPPSVGGMENFCYGLYSRLEKNEDLDVKVISLGKSQKNLVWFFPYCFFYILFFAKKYDVIIFSDALFAGCAWAAGKRAYKITDIHGLDVTYSNPLYRLYMKVFLKSFDLYVCNSKNTEKIINELGISKTTIISRGIDVKQYTANCSKKEFLQKYGLKDDAVIVITVGRLVKRKGVSWFVENVMPNIENEKVHYFIIGEGPEKDLILKNISESKVEDKVSVLGRVSDEELKDIYSFADVFVMPNIPVPNDVEGFGIVAIEASYNKCLVIASDIDGIADAVIDGKNGILVECKDVDRYVDIINDYARNRIEYEKIVENYSEYTRKVFSMDAISQQYVKIIKESKGK